MLLKLNNINTIRETKKFIVDEAKAITLVCFKLESLFSYTKLSLYVVVDIKNTPIKGINKSSILLLLGLNNNLSIKNRLNNKYTVNISNDLNKYQPYLTDMHLGINIKTCEFSTSCINKFNINNNVIFNNYINNIENNIPNDNIYSGEKAVLILYNSNSNSINSKINDIFKVYENLYLNNHFEYKY